MNGPTELIALIDQRIRAAAVTTRALATCQARDIIGPGATVTFDGSTLSVPVKVLGHVELRPGMRCTLDKYGSEWLVTGAFAVPTMGWANVFTFGVVTSTTSATYVGWGASDTWTFEKFHDATVIDFVISTSCYAATNTARGRWSVRMTQIDGDTPFTASDVEGPEVRYDTVAVRQYSTQRFVTPGAGSAITVPAGIYTCAWRWKRVGGSGTLTTDTTDMFSATMEEKVLPSSPYV